MDRIKRGLSVLKAKPTRKLTIVSAILVVLLLAVTFAVTFIISLFNQAVVLDGNISALPTLIMERSAEFAQNSEVYIKDFVSRGQLARTVYDNAGSLAESERLELVRDTVSSLDVTVLDASGKVVASTAEKAPSSAVRQAYAASQTSEDAKSAGYALFDPNMEGVNKKMEDEDGYVPETDSMPMVFYSFLGDGNVLMVELDYTAYGQLLSDQFEFDEIAKRAIAGTNGFAFMSSGTSSDISAYPHEQLSEDEVDQLVEDFDAMAASDLFLELKMGGGHTSYFSVAELLGTSHFVAKLPVSDMGLTFYLTVPLSDVTGSMVCCDLAIIALVVVGFVLFSRYAVRCFRMKPVKTKEKKLLRKAARRQTFAGVVVVLVVTIVLTTMLLMLEGMSNTAGITMAEQGIIKYELEYRNQRKKSINKEYSERYCTRARAIARLLTDYPELRSRQALQEFAKTSQAEYLMLFDKDGKELYASNGYTGFVVGDEASGGKPEWRPVLQGYEQVETATEKNAVTGHYERTIATLITDKDGLPDGFVLMVVNDDGYMTEIGDASLEGAVKGLAVRNGQVAAVVDNETMEITACTDDSHVGESAANFLPADVLGRDYEGYTQYDGYSAYVSGASADGKTTYVITRNGGDEIVQFFNGVIIGAITVLTLFIFYPAAASLCAQYERLSPDDRQRHDKTHPMMIFYHGYVGYIAVLAAVSFLGVVYGFWSAFAYVYSGKWTHGIHLFAIWLSLFIFAVISYVRSWIHRLIVSVDEQLNAQTRTFAHLVDSLITYAVTILTIILVLTQLGVDTAAIIGSVSIITVAVGMGSQDLVKDIVAGLFLIFEGTISVGDIVEIGGWRGRVTDMGVRTTEITNDSNDVKILTNSKIGDVINRSKVKTACAEEFKIPRTVEVSEVPALVSGYIDAVSEEVPEIAESLELDEVTSITESSYTIRLSYLVNEADRESATIRLRNAMLLQLEAEETGEAEE